MNTTVYNVSKNVEDTFIEGLFFTEQIGYCNDLTLELCIGCPKVTEKLKEQLNKGEITEEDFQYSLKFQENKCSSPKECSLFFNFREEVRSCIYQDYKIKTFEDKPTVDMDIEDFDDLEELFWQET